MKEKPDEKLKNFLQVSSTEGANNVDLINYRLERFSRSKDAYLFIKRRYKNEIINDGLLNFIETNTIDESNNIDLNKYRFEIFNDIRGTWIFVKRRNEK